MIKAVIFDVDGVLIDSLKANFHFYSLLFKTAGYLFFSFSEYKSKKMNHLTMVDVIKRTTKTKSKKKIKDLWLMGKNNIDYPYKFIQTPQNLIKVIKNLKSEFKLGVATSRVSTSLFDKISKLSKIKQEFSTFVLFEDTKEHKPHPAPLLLVAKKLGVKPLECVYIGDADSDVQAAKSAGMKIISYPKKLKGSDAYTSEFEKLPELISTI